MAKLTHLMIHCSASREGSYFDRTDIERWHLEYRKWSRVGYSGIILLDGYHDILIPYDNDDYIDRWEISNGAKGWNGVARHICYIGGLNQHGFQKDTRTKEQMITLRTLVDISVMLWPDIRLIGHNQVARKACPSFDVPSWCDEINLPDKNIDRRNYVG